MSGSLSLPFAMKERLLSGDFRRELLVKKPYCAGRGAKSGQKSRFSDTSLRPWSSKSCSDACQDLWSLHLLLHSPLDKGGWGPGHMSCLLAQASWEPLAPSPAPPAGILAPLRASPHTRHLTHTSFPDPRGEFPHVSLHEYQLSCLIVGPCMAQTSLTLIEYNITCVTAEPSSKGQ